MTDYDLDALCTAAAQLPDGGVAVRALVAAHRDLRWQIGLMRTAAETLGLVVQRLAADIIDRPINDYERGWTAATTDVQEFIRARRNGVDGASRPQPTRAHCRCTYAAGDAECGFDADDRDGKRVNGKYHPPTLDAEQYNAVPEVSDG